MEIIDVVNKDHKGINKIITSISAFYISRFPFVSTLVDGAVAKINSAAFCRDVQAEAATQELDKVLGQLSEVTILVFYLRLCRLRNS